MDEFRTIARHWPSGDELNLGEDTNNTAIPSTFTRNAAGTVADPNGGENLTFLFWNTGRRITGKRRVRWNFSVGGWGSWTATRWYGLPGGGVGGSPRLHLTAYSIREDRLMAGNPLAASASTMGAGQPLGEPAWPAEDARTIDTTHLSVVLSALASFEEPSDPTVHTFSGWLRLAWGGDTTGEFVETDTGYDVNSPNAPAFYVPFGSSAYSGPVNDSAELLAAYGVATEPTRPPFQGLDRWRDLLEILQDRGIFDLIDPVFDPSPIDRLRRDRLGGLLDRLRGGEGGADELERLTARASRMSEAQIRRAMTEVQSNIRRGEAALKALEVAARRADKK